MVQGFDWVVSTGGFGLDLVRVLRNAGARVAKTVSDLSKHLGMLYCCNGCHSGRSGFGLSPGLFVILPR